MKVDDEMLMALVDGELDPETATRLHHLIATDPSLQADYALFEQTAEALRESQGLGPVPERLIRQIRDTPVHSAPSQDQAKRSLPRSWRALAVAASLAVAFFAGSHFTSGPAPFAPADYALLPSGEARALGPSEEIRGISSYDTGEGFCRHLRRRTISEVEDLLLCRDEDQWVLRLAMRSVVTEGSFVTASALSAEAFDFALDELQASDALSQEAEEQQLRALSQ